MRCLTMLSLALVLGFVAVSGLSSDAAVATFSLSTKGDLLAFDKTEFTVKAKQTVKVNFKNGASPTSGLQHNWVLVKPGTADNVNKESVAAGAGKGWIAESNDILAHTTLLNPGETGSISFTAPAEKGDYPFICTFPGHAASMKGLLHVR